ncbi:hypothetical protein C8J57DRAFT_1283151 [Mycena rebaudengoi]|nr:hypothetical protein C8J57DRAFT_1283151 [Mycena rebaudengoi]
MNMGRQRNLPVYTRRPLVRPSYSTNLRRSLALRPVAQEPSPWRSCPLLDIPAEIGLEILELALLDTPSTILALVSKDFGALVSSIIYRTVVLDCLQRIVLFYRTVRSKSPEFLDRVKILLVTSLRYATETPKQLQEIVAACRGLRTLAVPRPGVLASSLVRVFYMRPSDLILQSFDAVTPFEWDPLFDQGSASPAAYLSDTLTHLRICEPGMVWHSPLSTLDFFGALPHLTHLALARRVNSIMNDVFVDEIKTLLTRRPSLVMLVVSLFPNNWPNSSPAACSLCSTRCICKALMKVADGDKRLVLLTAGWDVLQEAEYSDIYPVHACHGSRRLGGSNFWENWRMSDKRVVSLAAGWEPEILEGGVEWTYSAVPSQIRGRHNFWETWLVPN